MDNNGMNALLKALFSGFGTSTNPQPQMGQNTGQPSQQGGNPQMQQLLNAILGSLQGPHGQAGGPTGAMTGSAYPQWMTQLKQMADPMQHGVQDAGQKLQGVGQGAMQMGPSQLIQLLKFIQNPSPGMNPEGMGQ